VKQRLHGLRCTGLSGPWRLSGPGGDLQARLIADPTVAADQSVL